MQSSNQSIVDGTIVQVGGLAPSFLDTLKPGIRHPVRPHVGPLHAGLKRLIDFLVAGLLGLFALPLLVGIALLIGLRGDRGPLLFRQQRIGRRGRPFTCLKFRSMCLNADTVLTDLLARDEQARIEWAATHKLRNDPRISRIGRFLRSTSLDELPQIWNVLVGDMSLVGPRPVTQAELEGFYTRFDGRQQYLAVRPGLTGLWQVSGRNAVCYERRVEFDKIYVRDMSLLRDALILWQTVWVVLRRDGAC
ncbi:sugar transferase [Lichenicoccus sp.]|uniref:sugar transferase n=1 Tax=Lichenicoccus sp. TaxID=2781899 RepID=UPI003D116D45